ncbi:MAG: hypothetical protein Q9225_003408 [Loekoesia sp. 1 TL-2023]
MVVYGSTSLLNGFDTVDRLRIMPGINETMPRAACEFFRKHHEIRHLVLDFWHMDPFNDENDEHDEQDPAETGNGDLEALFAGLQPSTICLHTLDLTHVNLRGTHCELITALNFATLSDLTLLKCNHSQDFLKAMNKASKNSLLQLKEFTLYQSEDWPSTTGMGDNTAPNPLLDEVNEFLNSISKTLREIWICLRGFDRLPDAASIAQHGKTLKWLFIDVRKQKGPWAVMYSLQEWQMLCRSLAHVRQIDAGYPHVVADCQFGYYEEFFDYIHATCSIPTLKFLGVNTWPFPIGTDLLDVTPVLPNPKVNHRAYRYLLAALATNILGISSGSIEVMAFGIYEQITHRCNHGHGLSPMYFAKSLVQVLGGEQKMKMEPIEKYVVDRQIAPERKEYDIDGMAHEVGKFEVGVDDDEWW